MNNRHLSAVAASALFCLFTAGCGAPAEEPTPKTKSNDVVGSSSSSGGNTSSSSGGNTSSSSSSSGADPLPTPPAEAGACHLAGASASDVQVKFVKGTPPAATGGKLEGKYIVTSATVYLPGGTNPDKSTGTINAWGVFENGNYNLSMKVDMTISTIIGDKAAKQDVIGQGTFSTSAEKVVIETSCEGSAKPDVQVAFSEATSTLVVTAVQQGQTVYIELHATKG